MSEWGIDRSQPSSITLDIKLPSSSPVSQPQSTSSRSVFEPFQLQITIQIPSIRNSSQVIQTTVPYIDLPPTPPVCLPVQDEAQQREIELRDTLNKRKPTHISANITSRAGNLPTPASTSQSESPVEDGPMDNPSDATRQNSVVGRERIHHGITNDIDYRDSSYFRHQRDSTSDDKSPLAWRDEDADHKARNAPQNDSQCSFERSALAPRTPPGSPPRSRPLSRASQRSLSRSSERGRSLSRNSSRTRDCSPGSQGYRSPRTLRDQPSNAQYSASRSDCSDSYEPESPTKFQNHPMTVSLQDRMKGGQKDSLSKRTHRICPFYHTNSSDKHPPYKPHPGYQAGEFEEAVSIFAKQERLPKRLIKPGVVVNYRMQQDISSSTRSYSSGNNPERLQKGSRKRSHDHFTLESSNYGQHSKKRKFDTTQPRRNSYSIPGRAPTPAGGYGYPSDLNASQPANYRSNYRSTFNTSYPYYLENGAYHQRSYSDYQRQSPSSNW